MKAYMGYEKDCSDEGACLIFANNAKEAKSLAYEEVNGWNDAQWIDIRVKWLKRENFLFELADKEKLVKNIPHLIADLSSICCKICNCWGQEYENGICNSCLELEEE